MDSRHKVPFNIVFHQKYYYNSKTIVVKEFSLEPNFVPNNIPTLMELVDTSVEFYSDNNGINNEECLLYMDVLDILPDVSLDDDDKPYISLNSKMVKLFIQEKNDRSYPIIPGIYRICVKYKEKKYYSMFKVQAKNLSDDELQKLRDDLENVALGLAREINYKSLGIENINYVNNIIVLEQFSILDKNINKILYALQEIIKNPSIELNKNYCVTPYHKSKNLDDKSNRWLQGYNSMFLNETNIKTPKYVLTPNIEPNEDIVCNKWIKYIIKYFIKILKHNINQLKDVIRLYDKDIEETKTFRDISKPGNKQYLSNREKCKNKIENCINRSNFFINRLRYILNNSFFSTITDEVYSSTPLILAKEYKYWSIYSVYKKMKKGIKLNSDELFNFQWKATDILYEYWCFIKIIEALRYCYTPINGWIYDNKKFVPFLEDETYVYMEGENHNIKVLFNESIMMRNEDAISKNKYLWSRSNHNKPDIRIDIFDKNNKFLKTIVLDAKYRNAKNVWDIRKENKHFRLSTMIQLSEYVDKIVNLQNQHVTEVAIALCPNQNINTEDTFFNLSYGVIITELNPNIEINKFSHLLLELIESINTENIYTSLS